MKKIQLFALVVVTLLFGFSASLHAEDIDVYVANNENVGTPNVLFLIDNAADFSSNDSNFNCTLDDGSQPTLYGTAGGVEQCGLISMLSGLKSSNVNIGIMMGNANGFATDTRNAPDFNNYATTPGDAAYHEVCQGTYGGCLLRKFTLMNANGRDSFTRFIKSWTNSAQNSATAINVKSSTGRTANMMQEAWAYFNGKTGMSTKNYATSVLAGGCQKNFIVFIGNSASASGGPADGGSESPYNGTNALTTAAAWPTADSTLTSKITTKVTFDSKTCGDTSRTPNTNASDWSENWADEWARLLYKKDGGATGNYNVQNVSTYTIGIVDEAKNCKSDYPALLSSMATYGNGKYYKVASASDLKAAFDEILNEVQAVNSVFSAASLPVSVNAQGQYLNQIYLGMFRPDDKASPRWRGNLKQYQFIIDSTGNLVLGDANKKAAISSAGTGFISPTAQSFWTYKDTSVNPDKLGGFFTLDVGAQGTAQSGYDLADGEVVEKGGAAQQIRKENLTATFVGASNTANTNPRRVYTYCPSGANCVASLTDTSNDFATTNAGIAANAFGSSTTVKITSITRLGTTATVTTNGSHGFTSGITVTISNATPTDYNGDKVITVTGSNTFTFTTTDYPTTPATSSFTIAKASAGSVVLSGVTRSGASASVNSDTVTATSASSLSGFAVGSTATIAGINESGFDGMVTILSNTGSAVTYSVPIYPLSPSANAYTIVHAPYTVNISSISVATVSGTKWATVTTSGNHGFHDGQTITVAGTNQNKFDGSQTVTYIDATHFKFSVSGNPTGVTAGTVAPSTTAQAVTVGSISRTGTGASATATITGLASKWFGNGDKVNVAYSSGAGTTESQYVVSSATISCTAPCTSLSYTVSTNLPLTGTGSGTISVPTTTFTLPANSNTISRDSSGNVTINGGTYITANAFANGDSVIVSQVTTNPNESAYAGTWTITCTAPCQTVKYGQVTLSPATPATGTHMQAYSSSTPPDRDTVIKWIRGLDSYGDELGPCHGSTDPTCTVSVRPSIHADVLHSRPLVLNYGETSKGIVVYYGTNDGVFHAVNGNQTTATGAISAGGEFWGLVFPDHYSKLNRQRTGSPEIRFPTTTLDTAAAKDYMVDGPTGVYTELDSTNTKISKAWIYLAMRRGGTFMYGLDVSTPTTPSFKFKIDNTLDGFSELGQTWSRPRIAWLERDTSFATPVLIFGAGYDTAEDSEPPTTDSQGRGIYIINADTGALIWSATPTCTTSSTCLQVPEMKYAVPSDIALIDRNGNGLVDKLYFGDLGGNMWRVDVAASDTANFKVTKLAAFGCDTGTCSSGTTPRKFFFPPAVITTKSFDLVSLESGDREHPLKSAASGSSYYVADKFFMVEDKTITVNPTTIITSGVTMNNLTPITSSQKWTIDSNSGFYIAFEPGEKGVNAPLALNGTVYFSTNQPASASATCLANLGTARAWAVNPFTGDSSEVVLEGGGLPPSPVAGVVSIDKGDGTTEEDRFCIGCGVPERPGGSTPPETYCNKALQNCTPDVNVTNGVKRTYWYKK